MALQSSYVSFGFACSLLFGASSAWAQDPATDLSDLNYQSTERGHAELSKRGYQQQSNDGAGYEYWWNASKNQCVIVHSEGSKVASVVKSSPTDCGRTASTSGGKSDNTAGVLLAAAAIIGVAALAHKSNHHDNNQHSNDSQNEADFEKGYRDGLYNQPYDTYADNNSYQQGYTSGSRDRSNRTSYRGYSSGGPQVTCESQGNQRVECPMDTAGAVRVVRQLSHSPCTEGVSWGLFKHAVWVTNGCRAIFQKG